MQETKDVNYMQHALRLSRYGIGRTSPRPSVGAVVLNTRGEVVGEGFTTAGGESHAEMVALRQAGESARGGTIYVTLEPCNGEYRANGDYRCSRAILEAGIREVHYALDDPNQAVAGGGARLAQAGLTVIKGECAAEATENLRAFFKWVYTGLPYVILKYAMTLDGKIATVGGDSRWITGEAARLEVHRLRDESDAVLVGVNTVLADDPALTTRLPMAEQKRLGRAVRNPTRIILDSAGRTPLAAQVVNAELEGSTIVASTDKFPGEKRKHLEAKGIEVLKLPADNRGRVDVLELLQVMGKRGLLQLLVEGGGEVLSSFVQRQFAPNRPLADQVWAFIAPKLVGGCNAPGPFGGEGVELMTQAFTLSNIKLEQFGNDILLKGDFGYEEGNR